MLHSKVLFKYNGNRPPLLTVKKEKYDGLNGDNPPVKIITVPMFLAKDGTRISTTRIKNSEIDTEGNLLSID